MKTVHTVGKRKKSVARATLRAGNGVIRINKVILDYVQPALARLKIKEPVLLAGDIIEKINIDVNIHGGGALGQADAARLAIAKAILEHTKSDALRDVYNAYDWTLLVADVRQREPRKPNKHGNARGKTQKSYR